MSKKIMSVMLAIFMLASLCVVGMTSASAAYHPDSCYEIYATGKDNKSLAKGESINVQLKIDVGERAVQNGQFSIYYDATKLKVEAENDPQYSDEVKETIFPVSGDSTIAKAYPCYIPGLEEGDGDTLGHVSFNFTKLSAYKPAPKGYIFADIVLTAKEDIANLSDVEIVCDSIAMTLYKDVADRYTGAEETVDLFVRDSGLNSQYVNSISLSVVGGTPIVPTEIDTTELEKLIAEAKELAEKDGYTEESIAVLKDAIAAAEAVVANPESQEKVEEQIKALQAAIDALEKEQGPVEIDTTALEALIADAKEYAEKDIYTEESVADLKDAIAEAEAVVAAPESQDQVDAQVVALQAAIDNLVLVPGAVDTTELEKLVAEAKELAEKDGYTEESIAALKDAIAAAEAVVANPESQEKVEEQIKALQAAIDGLKKVEATTATTDTTATTATTAPTTTEKPEAPQTGESSTAVALMVVAVMAAGVVIFARKKAAK